jgi:hypothetical protein
VGGLLRRQLYVSAECARRRGLEREDAARLSGKQSTPACCCRLALRHVRAPRCVVVCTAFRGGLAASL